MFDIMFIHLGHLFINPEWYSSKYFFESRTILCLLLIFVYNGRKICFAMLYSPLFLYASRSFFGLLLLIPQAGKPRYKLLIELVPITTDQNLMQIYQSLFVTKKASSHCESLQFFTYLGFKWFEKLVFFLRFQIYFAVNYANLKALGYLYIYIYTLDLPRYIMVLARNSSFTGRFSNRWQFSSWWFQPISKLVKLDHFAK